MGSGSAQKNRAVRRTTATGTGTETTHMIVASLNEDPVLAPPVEHAANDELSSAIRDAVRENWAAIRTHVVNGPVQTRYNHRLTSLDTRDLHDQLFLLFDQQTTAFKINCSYGFILKNKTTNRFRYYHSSNTCCGRLLEEPPLITNRDDFDRFLARIQESDILQWAVAQRPNSDWICKMVTNATFVLNRIIHHPIGCVGVNLPDYVKYNKAIVGLEKDRYRMTTYNDNLCLFRCLALHLGREAASLYAEYTDTPVHDFAGVTIDDLSKIEATFGVNVVVYKLDEITDGKTTGELVRRSPCQYIETMYLKGHCLDDTYFLTPPTLARLRVQPVPIQRVPPPLAGACMLRQSATRTSFQSSQFAKFLEIVNNRRLFCRVVELPYIVDFFINM